MREKYAVAIGEMFDAIQFFGPFDDFDAVELWAGEYYDGNWWIVRLENPQKKEN
jgi:hypothetical protein